MVEKDILEQISELKKENAELRQWQLEVTKILHQMMTSLEDDKKAVKNVQQYAYINRIRIESIPYEMRDIEYKSPVFIPKVLSKHETRREIIDNHKSISRFGDGEFAIIHGIARWNFQSVSDRLAEKLQNVLQAEQGGLLVGIHRGFYGNLEDYSEADADAIRHYMRPEVRKQHAELLSSEKIYGHALFNSFENDNEVNELREIWNERDCVFIEGRHTGMGVGNDLFDNAGSIKRILAPAENAIDRYDDIMDAALKQSKDKLILIALGPTATALAYDLYKEGYQAIDIGHADLSYEKYIRKLDKLEDVNIPFKYCSWDEVGQRRQIEDIDFPEYCSQVVDRVY